MKNYKSLSLILALPLLITACNGPDKTPAPAPTPNTNEATTETPTTPETEVVEEETDSETEVEVDINNLDLGNVSESNEPPEIEGFVSPEDAAKAVAESETETEIEGFVAPEETTEEEPPAVEEEPESVAEPAAPAAEAGLTGTFVYDTKYGTPKGVTDLNTTFVVNNGVIESVALAGNPAHQTSIDHQVLFEAKLGDFVVGKNLTEVGALPAKVNGSSLTSTGFNSALEQLQNEA